MPLDFEAIYMQRQLSVGRSSLSFKDKEAITAFLNYLDGQGVSKRRLCKYTEKFAGIAKHGYLNGKDLTSLAGQDIDLLLKQINDNKKWQPWTKHDYQLAVKKFYKFHDGNNERAGRIKVITPAVETVDGSTVLNEQDLYRLDNAARSDKERAIVWLCFDIGARLDEFLSLKIKDVRYEPPLYRVSIHGTKNKYADRIVLVLHPRAVELLGKYLENHPQKDNPEAPLWLNFHLEAMEHRNLAKFLKNLSVIANLNKRINPHWFRHSSITYYRAKGMPDTVIEARYGWRKGSDMLRVYDHSNEDTQRRALLDLFPQVNEHEIEAKAFQVLKIMLSNNAVLRAGVKALHEAGRMDLINAQGIGLLVTRPGQDSTKKSDNAKKKVLAPECLAVKRPAGKKQS